MMFEELEIGTSSEPLTGTVEPSTSTSLVTVEPANIKTIFIEPCALDPLIAAVEKAVREHKPDTSTAKGRDAIRALAFKVAKTKTYLDGLGKDLVDEYKEIPKKIDANRKSMRDRLEALRDEARHPLDEWEAEQARRQAILNRLQTLSSKLMNATAEVIQSELNDLAIASPEPDDFAAEIGPIRAQAMADLQELLAARCREESDRAELARLREAEAIRLAEQAKKDEEVRIAREAAERATREAEQRAQAERDASAKREAEAREATQRSEREKAEAEQRAKDAEARAAKERQEAAEREEQARIEATQAERRRLQEAQANEVKERNKREADKEHRRALNTEARADLVSATGITDAQAMSVVAAIAMHKVRHITVNY